MDDFNNFICSDSDIDMCDDCTSGTFNILDDGPDADTDGLCDLGDEDDDNDQVPDVDDSCPLNMDIFEEGASCEVQDQMCFPIKIPSGRITIVCL